MGEDEQNPNILRNFSLSEIRLKIKFSKDSENTGRGGQGHLNYFQTEGDFFRGWLPLMSDIFLAEFANS